MSRKKRVFEKTKQEIKLLGNRKDYLTSLLDFGSRALFGPDKAKADSFKWKPIFFIADSGSGYFFASDIANYILGLIKTKLIFCMENLIFRRIQAENSFRVLIKLM